MKVHVYERSFLWLGAVLLVCCLGALLYSSLAHGIHLPGRDVEVRPESLRETPPFDRPGVRAVGDDAYEAVLIGYMWAFEPAEIRVPAGAEVTFIASTTDVIHGMHVEGTRLNMMLIPGQVSRNTYRFDEPGEHLIICHEYCGPGHHFMYGKVIVE